MNDTEDRGKAVNQLDTIADSLFELTGELHRMKQDAASSALAGMARRIAAISHCLAHGQPLRLRREGRRARPCHRLPATRGVAA